MAVVAKVFDQIQNIPQQAWDRLHTDEDSPFIEWEWLRTLEQTQCAHPSTGWQPHHITLWRDGLLWAAAPGYIKSHSEGEFVFDWSWAEFSHKLKLKYYPKLILAVPFTPATGSRVLCAPGESLLEAAQGINAVVRDSLQRLSLSGAHVLFPQQNQAELFEQLGWSQRYGMQFHWTNDNYQTPEDFLARFQSKRRNALKRERSQPQKDGVTITTHHGDTLDSQLIAPMFQFYLSTIDKFAWGRQYLNEAFFQRIIERFRHRIEWVIARDHDQTPIAGAFNLVRGSTLYGRYWGATKEYPFLHFNVCFYHSIDECIKRGLKRFEPGAGGEHKTARGFEPTITRSAHLLQNPQFSRAITDFLQRERAAIVEHVATEQAQSPLRRKE